MDQKLKIGIIGEFHPDRPSHNATNQALIHAAKALSINMDIAWLQTQPLENDSEYKSWLILMHFGVLRAAYTKVKLVQ